DQSAGFFVMTAIIAVIFIIAILINVRNVYEAPTNIDTAITLRFKDIWRILFTNKQLLHYIATLVTFLLTLQILDNVAIHYFTNKELLAYIGILVTFFLSLQILGNVAIYYFSYVAESKALFALFNAMGFMEIIALLLFPKVAKWLTREAVFPIAAISLTIGLI